ncbi:MAG: exonuclease subunit SbcD [Gemmataceae bacterium]|nr:exonuclease subunit SbcD [Gemmataceae bacterium]
MRILHTADWHLGDRLGRIDRTADIQRGVEQVARYCISEQIDVLLVAGDLFSELSRPEGLRQSIDHLQQVFFDFLLRGGTIVALTGNHDSENFCLTLRHALTLAAPTSEKPGTLLRTGRFYLATQPGLFRLDHPTGQVQFVLMPYPTPSRYLDGVAQRYDSLEEKNRALQAGFTRHLRELLASPAFQTELPTVLGAHIHINGAVLPSLYRISEAESIVFGATDLPDLAYVALGHIHKPQFLGGKPSVRYSGSVERLDLGESFDQKCVVVVEVGPEGCRGTPVELKLDATPIYQVDVFDPKEDLPTLRERYPDRERALVRYHLRYTAGADNLEAILRELDAIFPRWYERSWQEAGELGGARAAADAVSLHRSFHDTVFDYLNVELADHPDQGALRKLAEGLLTEESA